MRTLFGVGTPRSLQGRVAALLCCLWSLIRLPETLWDVIWTCTDHRRRSATSRASRESSAGLVCRNRFHHGLLGTRDQGPGTRDRDQDQGPGTRDQGLWTRDYGLHYLQRRAQTIETQSWWSHDSPLKWRSA